MPEPSKSNLAERATRHRRGVATKLADIQMAIDELAEDVRTALAARGGRDSHVSRERECR